MRRRGLLARAGFLAPGFAFVSDGTRLDGTSFVTMIKGLGIHHPRVRLSNIVGHRAGDVGYLVYDRVESFESHGRTKVAPETGTMVLARTGTRWRIALWTATSPQH
jgi:ketosteroid isomerase-like protein